jgi:signal transduction histidine kinase
MKLKAALGAATDTRTAPEPEPGGVSSTESDRPLRRSLQGKILSRALLISIVPLLLIASVTLGSLLGLSRSTEASLDTSRQSLLRNIVGGNAREDAISVMRQVERLMAERIGNVMDWADTPSIYFAATQAARDQGDALADTPIEEVEATFADDRRLEPGSVSERYLRALAEREPMFAELFFTDRNGFVVGGNRRTSDVVQRDETWWAYAWEHGLYLGPVVRDASADAFGVPLAVRIDNPRTNRPVGVMRAVISLNVLQRTATDIANKANNEVSLITRDELLLAETASDHAGARIMNPSVEFNRQTDEAFQAALGSTNAGYLIQENHVVGYMSLLAAEGDLWPMLEDAEVDTNVLDWVAVVRDTNDDALTPLSGLDVVQESVTSTGQTFVILGLLALLAVIAAAFVVSTRLANGIVRPLRSLRRTAHDIADRQLPALVEQVQHVESDDELPSVPSVELHTDDEIEDVAEAFNVVRSTAVQLAAEQARSRKNVSRMFVSLGRRNQGLLSRQLEFIDRLESEESNPELLDNLFRLDHLATRMRRNAESLLVLAGEQPSRRWSEPVSLTDVVRGAVAEVEDYQRVNLEGVEEAKLAGSAVGDVAHLLAELIENATHFSPPDSTVLVLGRRVTDGYALAIVDDGVGMTPEQLRAANQRIETSPQIERVPSSYLGLFVVGRLAARHGIKVRLVESTTEGVTAKVLLPTSLVEPMPLEWPSNEVPSEPTTTFDEHAVPVAVGGPQSSAVEVAEPELPVRSGAPTAFQAPSRRSEPTPPAPPSHDDTADLPGLGVRRRSSKRGDAGRSDNSGPGGGREAARTPDFSGDRTDGGSLRDDFGSVGEPTVTNGRRDPVGARDEEHADQTGEMRSGAFEVPRRTSKRTDELDDGGNGAASRDRTVLRMEQQPSPDDSVPEPAASSESSTNDAERNAQAAKERLARFQRAVRQGRAQTGGPLSAAERNGGDRRDA